MENLLRMSVALFISTISCPSKVLFGSQELFFFFLLAQEPAVANSTIYGRQTAPWHSPLEKKRTLRWHTAVKSVSLPALWPSSHTHPDVVANCGKCCDLNPVFSYFSFRLFFPCACMYSTVLRVTSGWIVLQPPRHEMEEECWNKVATEG